MASTGQAKSAANAVLRAVAKGTLVRPEHDGSLTQEQARELVTAKRGAEAVEAAKANGKPGIRDRIKDFRRVPASELLPNPKNWRLHPKPQQDAMRGVLAEIGYADALLARELPDGSLELIDGHLRRDVTPDQVV